MTVTVVPLAVPGPLGPGLDLVATLLAARTATPGTVRAPAGTPARRHPGTPTDLRDGDVVLVASKVVALAEGRLVELPAAAPGRDPRRVLARRHARRIVVDDPRILVVETDHGLVCANAGIDTSNVPDGQALLLPTDPDGSAFRLRQALRDAIGVDVGVVVTDTFGRPWREGQVDVAIGSAGITPLRDERGSTDLHGRHLEVTVAAVADELAGVADLVRDKATPVPFVVVRGLDLAGPGVAADLVRPAHLDLFPAGGPTLADHALALGAIPAPDRPTRIDPDVDPLGAVRAVAVDDVARTAGVVVTIEAGRGRAVFDVDGPDEPAGWRAVGRVLGRLEVAARARGWSTATTSPARLVCEISSTPAQSSTTKPR